MLKASAKSEGNYQPIEAGTYQAVCYGVIDLGTHINPKYNKKNRKILIQWELPDITIEIDGQKKRKVISKEYTLALSEKATLRKDLVAWRGKQFTEQELEGFDISKLISANCILNIIINEKGYNAIASISSLMKSMKPLKPENPTVVIDLDNNPDLTKIPEWIANKIKQSEEYQGASAMAVQDDPYAGQDEPEGDGIPF